MPRSAARRHRASFCNGFLRVYELTDDGGARWDTFWGWVAARIPEGPLWHLDSVGVDPAAQGRGIGSSLVEFGVTQAHAAGVAAVLETGSARNVPLYERLGFSIIDEVDAPEGGPHTWFMRADP